MSLGGLAGCLGWALGTVTGRWRTGVVGTARRRRRRREAMRHSRERRTRRRTKAAPTPMPTSSHRWSPNTSVP
uniref:Secreted protein n=1 Tax=Arundo donax TaxID=35708 RepID=A0A0A8ZZ01_ARUDO